MRLKVFASKGPWDGVRGKFRHKGNQFYRFERIPTLEYEINQWLYQNPAITISEIRQSMTSGWFGRKYCVVTIWYDPPKHVLTEESARKLVLNHVNASGEPESVVITEVIERPFGWVFHYNYRSYIETGDDGQRMIGNYPILVDRHTCTLHFTGLEEIEYYIERYEKTGETGIRCHRSDWPGTTSDEIIIFAAEWLRWGVG